MELRYYINTTQISEPIGFDDFKTILKRTEQHGVSAESSVGELEFDGVGFGIIQTAYNTDIDTELIFKAEIKCDDNDTVWSELYSGILDLSTYEETYSDYCGCKVKVGEIGVKTTFNNRVDTVVDIARLTSLDGDVLSAYSNIDKEITIPAKDTQKAIKTLTTIQGTFDSLVFKASDALNVAIPFGDAIIRDLTTFTERYVFNGSDSTFEQWAQFKNNEISIVNNSFRIEADLRFSVLIETAITFTAFKVEMYVSNDNVTPIYSYDLMDFLPTVNIERSYSLNPLLPFVTINKDDILIINIIATTSSVTNKTIKIKINPENRLFIAGIETFEDTTAKISLIHESLSRLTEIYSGLTVKSDFYGRSDSDVNPLSNGVGDGALKSIVNGLKLRNTLNADGTNPRIETSFKDMFTALNAIDNIGWGFASGSGIDYVRVENWKWFYNSNEIMTIDAPANKKRRMRDDVFTRLKIGYNKYGGQDDINSIDTFHTNREYTSGIKAIDKQNSQLSKFISDPYAIEFTRRKALDKTTKDWKYDEDIFLLCLKRDNNYDFTVEQGVDGSGDVVYGTIISPETMNNFRISPKRNAMRWADRLFELNSAITDYKYTAGVGNVSAKGEPTVNASYDYLNDIGAGAVIFENSDIAYVAPHLKPELIEFEYPLTLAEYDAIKAEPYGQIVVDGEACYIKEIIREVMTGMCDFKLIPKF